MHEVDIINPASSTVRYLIAFISFYFMCSLETLY